MWSAKDLTSWNREWWTEKKEQQKEADVELQRVRMLNILTEQDKQKAADGGQLSAPWASETKGWKRVKVIINSGAAESVAPKSMAPQFLLTDSPVSRAGFSTQRPMGAARQPRAARYPSGFRK